MTSKTIYLAQHGLAKSKEQDPERPLSDEGIKQTKAIAQHLARLDDKPEQVFHSGKKRAQQTAEILAVIGGAAPLSVTQQSHMSPNDDIHLLADNLVDRALYVGHLPHLDKLCNHLLTGNEDSGVIQFHNSAILCLKFDDSLKKPVFQLSWYLTPASSSPKP